MARAQIYEGTPAQLAEKLSSLPVSQKYLMTLTLEEQDDDAESLEAAIARMKNRTPEEIVSARERILSATPPPRELPDGKNIFEVVMGKWPGDETDEEILSALDKLS